MFCGLLLEAQSPIAFREDGVLDAVARRNEVHVAERVVERRRARYLRRGVTVIQCIDVGGLFKVFP